jgi:serine/threonine-protein kinase
MLVGEPLFDRTTDATTLHHVLYAPAPAPRSKRPEVPADIEHVTMCLLEKDRDARYPTARAAIAALKDCAAFSKHGRELLTALLLERFPSRIPHPHRGRMAPVPSEPVVDAEPSGTRPNVEPMAQADSHLVVEQHFAELAVKQPARSSSATGVQPAPDQSAKRRPTIALRLAALGAVAMIAAIITLVALNLLLRDSSSRVVVSPAAPPFGEPPSAASPANNGEHEDTKSTAGAASAEAPRQSPVVSEQSTASSPSEGSASTQQLDRPSRSTFAPTNRARIIKIDLDSLSRH